MSETRFCIVVQVPVSGSKTDQGITAVLRDIAGDRHLFHVTDGAVVINQQPELFANAKVATAAARAFLEERYQDRDTSRWYIEARGI